MSAAAFVPCVCIDYFSTGSANIVNIIKSMVQLAMGSTEVGSTEDFDNDGYVGRRAGCVSATMWNQIQGLFLRAIHGALGLPLQLAGRFIAQRGRSSSPHRRLSPLLYTGPRFSSQ